MGHRWNKCGKIWKKINQIEIDNKIVNDSITSFLTKDTIEIKKDTDRIEEIKALKRAWESIEAGRAAKVN